MASKSFFSRHPIITIFLGLLLLIVVAGVIFFQTTSKEEIVAKGKTLVMPDFKSVKVQIEEITADSVKSKITLRINNTLPMAIEIDSIQYKVTMEGDTVTKGFTHEGIRINANSNDEVTVNIRTNIKKLTKKVDALEQDSADVGIYAILYNHFPVVGNKEIPVNFHKTVYIPKIPKIEMEGIDISNLNFKGGKLLVKMKITNYSAMPFSVNGFDYRFRMSDNIDMKGKSAETFNFNKKGSEVITIPLELKLDQVGEAAWELLFKSEDTPYHINGDMHIVTNKTALGNFDMAFQKSGTLKELKEAAKAVAKDAKDAKEDKK